MDKKEFNKQEKETEKDIKHRQNYFGKQDDHVDKKILELQKGLNKEDSLINSTLFGGYEHTVNQINNTEYDPSLELAKRLEKLNNKYKPIIGSNPMEFLNRIEMDSKTLDPNEKKVNGKNGRIKKLESMLKNSNGEFFLEEKDRFFKYEDYRLIDSYIPEVSKCLDLYRDCILSPDDLTKTSLNYYYNNDSISNKKSDELIYVTKNLDTLETLYDLKKIIRTDIREGCKIGDLFYLIMPYNVGFTKVFKENMMNESFDIDADQGTVLTEDLFNLDDDNDFKGLFENEIYLNEDSKRAVEKKQTIEQAKKDILDSINNNIKFYKDPSDILSEKKQESAKSKNLKDLKLTGSIFKKLAPENIVVLELDEQVLGYIYIEKNNINLQHDRQGSRNMNPNSLRSGNTGSSINTSDSLGYGSNDIFNSRYDYLNRDQTQIKSKYALISSIFVKGISKKVNKDFLMRNQEFKKLIYTLVHEEYITKKEIKMTFIEPQYIYHFKLESTDLYGVSKMAKSIFFCKLYLSQLLTNIMQKVIRGRDRRAYYIETGLDDDMEGTVQEFIRDVKSKELTSGYLKNITTILNSVGAAEDFYIPTIDGQRSIEIKYRSPLNRNIESKIS